MKERCIVIIYNILEEDRENYYTDVNSVEDALTKLGYDVKKISVGQNINEVLSDLKKASPMCIFNLCEGFNGNSWGEVYIAGLLELLGMPYTGSGPFGLALALNKAKTKDVLRSNGIKVPLYQVFNRVGSLREFFSNGVNIPLSEMLKFPLIVKPLHEDGSYGIDCDSVVYDERGLYNRINIVYEKFKEPAIVEKYIDGREINVSILGNNKNSKILPISEIDYSNMPLRLPRVCSYRAKWESKSKEYKNTVPICPADLSINLKKKLEKIAIKVFNTMECRDYARVDIRLDKFENPYIIDVNPNPCLNPDSGFVCSAKMFGLDYKELIGEILNICMQRSLDPERSRMRSDAEWSNYTKVTAR